MRKLWLLGNLSAFKQVMPFQKAEGSLDVAVKESFFEKLITGVCRLELHG